MESEAPTRVHRRCTARSKICIAIIFPPFFQYCIDLILSGCTHVQSYSGSSSSSRPITFYVLARCWLASHILECTHTTPRRTPCKTIETAGIRVARHKDKCDKIKSTYTITVRYHRTRPPIHRPPPPPRPTSSTTNIPTLRSHHPFIAPTVMLIIVPCFRCFNQVHYRSRTPPPPAANEATPAPDTEHRHYLLKQTKNSWSIGMTVPHCPGAKARTPPSPATCQGS